MYNNPYMNNINSQQNLERINYQISELEKMKEQMQRPIQQPTNLTQNFQLAPTRDVIKYASSIDEVQREMVIGDTPFFSKDMSIVWIKNTKGDIKTYELTEIIPKDDKDIQIEMLQAQIDELRKGIEKNEQFITNDISTKVETNTSRNDETNGKSVENEKPSSVQRVSTSKKGK